MNSNSRVKVDKRVQKGIKEGATDFVGRLHIAKPLLVPNSIWVWFIKTIVKRAYADVFNQ